MQQLKVCLIKPFFLLVISSTTAQHIAPQDLFVLSPSERARFQPVWQHTWGNNFEDFPLQKLWDAFDQGVAPIPLNPNAGPQGWYTLNGTGSQNHSLLWIGESALGYALLGDAAQYDLAAQKAIILLDSLDQVQGHMRHEAVGQYVGFWQGGVACMALAGYYAPDGSTLGPRLLASARRWWADHIAVLRRLRMPDGQVALIGARLPGEAGTIDAWMSLSAAVNMQLIDPLPHDVLHPNLASLVSEDGEPLVGTGGVPVVWHRHRHVAERWVVLKAVQAGAILRVPAGYPAPHVVQDIYRWTAGNTTFVAAPAVIGYPSCRYKVSWSPGQVLRVEVADPNGTTGGKGLPNGHLPPQPVNIPAGAMHILGPAAGTTHPPCSQTSSCENDAAVVSIVKPYRIGCMQNPNPRVVIKNAGTNPITNLSLYYQINNHSLYSKTDSGAIKSKNYVASTGSSLLPDSLVTLTLDASAITPGEHKIKVWIKDVNKVADINASNDRDSITFEVVTAVNPIDSIEDFEDVPAGQIPDGWTLYNPDDRETWFVFGTGTNKAAAFHNHAYTGAQNERDELILPVLNLTGQNNLWFTFDLCHASRLNAVVYDSLQVMISTDCGQTFTSLWGQGETRLNTVPDDSNVFIPSGPQDYRKVNIDLSGYTSNDKAIFKFVNWSNNGNSTLVDNINLVDSLPCVKQHISINAGWNIISSYIIPDNPDMLNVVNDISDQILIVKDGAGESAIPSLGTNTIGNWNVPEGYKIKSLDPVTLTMGCVQVDPTNTSIPLPAGWSIISYLRTSPMDITTALGDVANDMLLIKNAAGDTFIPQLSINTIGDMLPGQGYKVKMLGAKNLSYPAH